MKIKSNIFKTRDFIKIIGLLMIETQVKINNILFQTIFTNQDNFTIANIQINSQYINTITSNQRRNHLTESDSKIAPILTTMKLCTKIVKMEIFKRSNNMATKVDIASITTSG
jgi:hypothetical protein